MGPEEIIFEDPFAGLPIVSPETHGRHSPMERLALAAQKKWGTARGAFEKLEASNDELLAAYYDVTFGLRPVQRVPSITMKCRWKTYFMCGGRGCGKTHAGASAVIEEAMNDPFARILIVGPTYTEIQKNQLKGPSGIITLSPPWFKPEHHKNDKQLVFPNGVVADYLPAQDADKFRGYGYTFEWLDEIVAWKRDPVAVYKECLRVGRGITPRMRELGLPSRRIITTTPAGTPVFKEILEDRDGLVVGQSTTFDNAANLDPAYIRQARRSLEDPVGRQEYLGQLRWAMDPTIYRHVQWDRYRVASLGLIPQRRLLRLASKPLFDLLVVSVDPATGDKKTADTHGVVVMGIREEDDELLHAYVFEDLSEQSPDSGAWVKAASGAFHKYRHLAERAIIFVESNTGGGQNRKLLQLHDSKLGTNILLKRAGRGAGGSKADRGRPVAMLASAGYVHLVGRLPRLEAQLAKFTGAEGGHSRDDRADAFAWPIFWYIARSVKMRGTVSLAVPEEDEAEGEE
jgi:phage terminase large subunit-like protein